MARIRTIKPEIAKHELLFELEQRTKLPIRFAWAVLPTVCDREGRFKWRPRSLKTDVLPFDAVEFEDVLNAFVEHGFIVKYRVGEEWFGAVPTFGTHQRVNGKESPSSLPSPPDALELPEQPRVIDANPNMDQRKGREGKGTERNGKEGSSEAVASKPPVSTSPTFLEFPVVGEGGTLWRLTEALVAEFTELYPTVDVRQESRAALGWVRAVPGRRKTGGGMRRFLNSWLTRAVDSRGGRSIPTAKDQPGAMPDYHGWSCPHVVRCNGRQQCKDATVLGRPVKAAS